MQNLKKLIGEGPYPFKMENANETMDFHYSDNLLILANKKSMDFSSEATHVHSSFEFVIPQTPMPPAWAGRNKVTLEKNKLFPFNSEQEHGPAGILSGCSLISLQLDKDYVYKIAREIFGQPEVYFANEPFRLTNEMEYLIRSFIIEDKYKQAGHEFILDSLCNQITVHLLRMGKNNLSNSLNPRSYYEKESINKAIDFLHEHYNKEYSLDNVAKAASLSPYYFIRFFKTHTGKTPYHFYLELKIEKACNLLKKTNHSVTEICYSCGFNNLSHFAVTFKRVKGITPSEYRKAKT